MSKLKKLRRIFKAKKPTAKTSRATQVRRRKKWGINSSFWK